MYFASILSLLSLVVILGFWGVILYTLLLAIKALKIYIKKNS